MANSIPKPQTSNPGRPGTIPGTYCDGATGRSQAVLVHTNHCELIILAAGSHEVLARWQQAKLHWDQPATDYLIIYHHDLGTASLEISGKAHLAQLKAFRRGQGFWQHHRRQLLSVMAATTLIISLLLLSLDPLASWLTTQVPRSYEDQLATATIASYQQQDCADSQQHELMQQLAADIAPKSGITWRFAIIRDTEANAFALPGGVIVFTDKLLAEAASADEFAGVMAHEMAHIIHRHSLKRLIRSAVIALTAQALLGGMTDANAFGPTMAQDLTSLSFSRDDESEADLTAQRLLRAAELNDGGLAAFFARQQDSPTGLSFLATHPEPTARLAALSPSRQIRGRAAMSAAAWHYLKTKQNCPAPNRP